MKKTMLVLLVLFALVSGVEAFEVMDNEEFTLETFQFELGPKIYDYTIVFSTERRYLGLYIRDLIGSFEHDKIFICLAYVYIMLSPIEFVGLILLGLTIFIIIHVALIKNHTKKKRVKS